MNQSNLRDILRNCKVLWIRHYYEVLQLRLVHVPTGIWIQSTKDWGNRPLRFLRQKMRSESLRMLAYILDNGLEDADEVAKFSAEDVSQLPRYQLR